MRAVDLTRLVALATIWSLSFVFIRVLAPVLGPVWVATTRLALGGATLVAMFVATRRHLDLSRNWRAYLFVGMLNSALPFLLFAWAALTLPASYLVILNGTLPLFGALVSAMWLGEALDARMLGGLAMGIVGVVVVSRAGPLVPDLRFALAVAASLAAVACYALGGVWVKRHGRALHPIAIAGWSQLLASVAMLPVAAASPVSGPVTMTIAVNAVLLAVLCSSIAYVLYYRLIADIGATRAMTVTFLMPALGMLWGAWFLGETVTLPMLAGATLIVTGTVAVLHPRGARAQAS
ncbi:MAG TPA: DMT family transporter [Casimicrobiaceae bacterium]